MSFDLSINYNFNKNCQSDNCFICYFSSFNIHNLDNSLHDTDKQSIKNIINKNKDGELFIVLPSDNSLKAIVSNNHALCLSIFDDNNDISYNKYCEILKEQNAVVKLLKIQNETYLIAINKIVYNKLIDITINKFNKYFNKNPQKIFLRISSNDTTSIISNIPPTEETGSSFYFEVDISSIHTLNSIPTDISLKINEIKNSLTKMHPNINVEFDFNNYNKNNHEQNNNNKQNNSNDEKNNDNEKDRNYDGSDIDDEDYISDIDKNIDIDSIDLDSIDHKFDYNDIAEYTLDLSTLSKPNYKYKKRISNTTFNLFINNVNNSHSNKNMLCIKYIFYCIWSVTSHYDIPIKSMYWNKLDNSNINELIKKDLEYIKNNTDLIPDDRYKTFLNLYSP